MQRAVEALVFVGVGETEVGPEVDDALRVGEELVDVARGRTVRQAREEDVAGRQLAERHVPEPREAAQVGVGAVRELPRQALRSHLRHLDIGMGQQQAQKLAARVSGAAGDRNPDHRTASRRYDTIRSGMFTPVTSMLFRNSIV